MQTPKISEHFMKRQPSAIRLAQIEFQNRSDKVESLNTAIGNISLPMHPAMRKRLLNLDACDSPFNEGRVMYTQTAGTNEANNAFLNIIAASGFKTDGLYSQITDGASQAMELAVLGTCGPAGSNEKPLLLIDPSYVNYECFANRVGRKTVSVKRLLNDNGVFTLPDMTEIENTIKKYKPGAIVVIPYDNPTGQFFSTSMLIVIAKLCVKYDMWFISDEAYRECHYVDEPTSSIWGIDNSLVQGIEGRRISLETASKVWNACGLRIGALITDNSEFHKKSVAEYTANLCANAIGQYIFGSLAHESHDSIKKWYEEQRDYYKPMMSELKYDFEMLLPGVIVSSPDASFYSVIDVRNIVKPGFKSLDFILYCARYGKVKLGNCFYTILVAPMSDFYIPKEDDSNNPGDTQMRVAFVMRPEKMILLPRLFSELFKEFEKQR